MLSTRSFRAFRASRQNSPARDCSHTCEDGHGALHSAHKFIIPVHLLYRGINWLCYVPSGAFHFNKILCTLKGPSFIL